MNDWRPIEVTPINKVDVLVHAPGFACGDFVVASLIDGRMMMRCDGYAIEVTGARLWQPLPKLPRESGK